jgi:RHH-type proline utilization regulon transcriptional repressor/proline dehydrogenase/delta 1-pyrroline-5-carboxylate dehydrogenase
MPSFANEPPRNFSVAAQREAFGRAVHEARLPAEVAWVSVDEAERAIERAYAARIEWGQTDVRQRAAMLLEAARRLRQQRDALAAVIILEAGKTWQEADADVCETIDFCEYYARQAIELFTPLRLGQFLGELNLQMVLPHGVAAVISPWNFPMAICGGMTVAALVTGNPTLVKPAEQTSRVARRFCEILWQSGVPRDALQFLPGPGETVGARLVRHPHVALVAFTGSRQVGFEILEAAGRVGAEQPMIRQVICEMGGKNAIVVDSTADLDEAVAGVCHSAFRYAGQKCSACSRAIVVEACYEAFLQRLIAMTASLRLGDPRDPATDVGPVIDAAAAERIRNYLTIGRQQNRLALAVPVPESLQVRIDKPLIGPHIYADVAADDLLACDEVFGPVLAVMPARSFDEALILANRSVYKLTGGVYSRTPRHLEQARQQFHVGNLYLNRGITGALVGRQPFGGFGHSGTGTKAGGQDYLRHFVNPQIICEHTMRRGFAPELTERMDQPDASS